MLKRDNSTPLTIANMAIVALHVFRQPIPGYLAVVVHPFFTVVSRYGSFSIRRTAWLSGFRRPPKQTSVVHGEPTTSEVLHTRVDRELGWNGAVPRQEQVITL